MNKLTFRISDEDLNELKAICEDNEIPVAQALRGLVRLFIKADKDAQALIDGLSRSDTAGLALPLYITNISKGVKDEADRN